jgi:RNA polymerase sigma-70 factor, ECF subfamily
MIASLEEESRPPMMHVEPEAQLVAACRQGDREAFRALFESYKDHVYGIALSFFAGDEAAARDAAQEVFVRLLTRIGDFQGKSLFSTWLYRLVANTCIDEHRRRRRFVALDENPEPAAQTQDPEDRWHRRQIGRGVRRALAGLSPKLRIVLVLKYFEELSYEEIAGALGCSVGTVSSRLHRGHRQLERRLNSLRPAPTGGGRS